MIHSLCYIIVSLTLLLSFLSSSTTTAFAPRAGKHIVAPPSFSTTRLYASTTNNVDTEISDCLTILTRAADTKTEDPEMVYDALVSLEKLQRQKAKSDPSVAKDMLSNLNGSWRLVFTTGTADTQKKIKGKVNYFPLKVCFLCETVCFPILIDPDWKEKKKNSMLICIASIGLWSYFFTQRVILAAPRV